MLQEINRLVLEPHRLRVGLQVIPGNQQIQLGRVAQSVTCLTVDTGVSSLITAQPHTFVKIDHEIISMAILLPSADSRSVVVSYKRKYVHKVLVNRLVKLAQEKSVVR